MSGKPLLDGPLRCAGVAAVVALGAAGVRAAGPAAAKTVGYKSDAHHFSVRYPAGWQADEAPIPGSAMVLLESVPEGQTPSRMIMVLVEPAGAGEKPTIESMGQKLLKDFNGPYPDGEMTKPQPARLSGEPANRFRFKGHDAQNNENDSVALVCVHDNAAYALTCVGPAEEFDKELAAFERVAETFRFTDVFPGGGGVADAAASFEDAEHHLKLRYPASWKKHEVTKQVQSSIFAAVPTDKEVRGKQTAVLSVDVFDVRDVKLKESDVDVYVERVLLANARKLDSSVRILKSEAAQLGGHRARRAVMNGRSGGVPFTRDLIASVHGDTVCTLFFACDPADYDKYLPVVDAIYDSFEWTDKNPAQDDPATDKAAPDAPKFPF